MEGNGNALTAVCRFWRERCREEKRLGNNIDAEYCHIKHPLSLVLTLCKESKPVQKFIALEEIKARTAVARLKNCICHDYGPLMRLLFEHATYLELLGNIAAAAEKASEAASLAETCPHTLPHEYVAQLESYQQRKTLEIEITRQRVERLCHSDSRLLSPPHTRQILHIPFGSISHSEFIASYASRGIPVIFTGADQHMLPCRSILSHPPPPARPWTPPWLLERIGHQTVAPKIFTPHSVLWAKHEDAPSVPLADILTACFPETLGGTPSRSPVGEEGNPYLVDWSLPLHCEHLLQSSPCTNKSPPPSPPPCDTESSSSGSTCERKSPDGGGDLALPTPGTVDSFRMPVYFAHDLLQLCPEGSLYRNTWPSLFVGGAGTRSGLHVDSFGSHFWMLLLEGRKQWVFFDRQDMCLLHPSYPFSFDPVFPEEAEKLAAAAGALSWEVVLQPGELLFVPAGAPHSVRNLDATVAISGNYVDMSNFDLCEHALRQNSLTCSRSRELLTSLLRVREDCDTMEFASLGEGEATVSWADFKSPVTRSKEEHAMGHGACLSNMSLPGEGVEGGGTKRRRIDEVTL